MLKKKGRTAALVAGTSAVLVVVGMSPAFAEGQFTSTLSGARPGYNSSSWQDSNTDSHNTTVAMTGCSLPQSGGLAFDIELKLYDEHGLFPDQSVGTRMRSSCGTFNWGHQTHSDRYHWNIFALSGSTSHIHSLNAHAVTRY